MKEKNSYSLFIGLIALMEVFIILISYLYKFPKVVLNSFYYINFIISVAFLLDYFYEIIINYFKFKIIKYNLIDLISIIPLFIREVYFKDKRYYIIFNFFIIVILLIKFKNRIRNIVRINKFNYMLVINTLVIIFGAILISLLEEMSFEDAVWWSFVTFTTIGYGDVLIRTTMGRIIAVILMVFGIGFIGITTSTIAAYLVNKDIKRENRNFKYEAINEIKRELDNFDDLSIEELDYIYNKLKLLKKEK